MVLLLAVLPVSQIVLASSKWQITIWGLSGWKPGGACK